MPYTPTTGDRVTVTRITPDGRTYQATGILARVSVHGLGFSLRCNDGTQSWHSDAATLLRLYGVTQTIELALEV